MNKICPIYSPIAELWIGNSEVLYNEVEKFLQRFFCKNKNSCGTCLLCSQIISKQHHSIIWIEPEKQYTLSQIEVINTALSFAVEKDTTRFLIIKKADALTESCANSLLKIIEEPPLGNYFILLAERIDAIMPTIRSRCITKKYTATQSTYSHPLFTFFTQQNSDILAFDRVLTSSKINEHESKDLLDHILHYWIACYKRNLTTQSAKTITSNQVIRLLTTHSSIPPMPGSGTLFWRNIFLQMHTITSQKDTVSP
jgi:hypothetical protein